MGFAEWSNNKKQGLQAVTAVKPAEPAKPRSFAEWSDNKKKTASQPGIQSSTKSAQGITPGSNRSPVAPISAPKADIEYAVRSMEPQIVSMNNALETAQRNTKVLEQNISRLETQLSGLYESFNRSPSEQIAAQYDRLYADYERMYAQYEASVAEYNKAYEKYQPIAERYGAAYEIATEPRSMDEIRAEMEDIDRQIEENRQRQQDQLVTQGGLPGTGRFYGLDQPAGPGELGPQMDTLQAEAARSSGRNTKRRKKRSYLSLTEAPDWQQLSAPVESTKDDKYKFINDINGYRQDVKVMAGGTAQAQEYGSFSPYAHMTQDEIGIYNYLYKSQGKSAAEKYLGYIEEELNKRYGQELYENIDTGVGRMLFALPAGGESWSAQLRQIGKREALPTTPIGYASELIRSDMSNEEGLVYDLMQTTAQQVPSILLSTITGGLAAGVLGASAAATVGQAVGLTSMSLSASGGAYNQAIKDGKDPGEARLYAGLVGASEGLLQYLLGGISKLGGKTYGGAARRENRGLSIMHSCASQLNWAVQFYLRA